MQLDQKKPTLLNFYEEVNAAADQYQILQVAVNRVKWMVAMAKVLKKDRLESQFSGISGLASMSLGLQ